MNNLKLTETVVQRIESPVGHEWISFPVFSKHEKFNVTMDMEDLPMALGFRWRPLRLKYTTYVRSGNSPTILLHRLILGLKDDKGSLVADHFDGDGLNNTKRINGVGNLHIVTRALNNQNTLRYGRALPRGVHWSNSRKKWCAQIRVNNKAYNLGRFETLEEADRVAREARKSFGMHVNESRNKTNG